MKKTILIILGAIAGVVFLVAVAGMYKFNYLASQPGYDVDGNMIEQDEVAKEGDPIPGYESCPPFCDKSETDQEVVDEDVIDEEPIIVEDFEGEADPNIMTLDMHTWRWIKAQYNNDTELTPNQTDAFTLTFTEDGSVSATTDCNNMMGSYEVEDNQITFSPMAMTRMFCPESQEQEFAKMFQEIQSFFFTSKGELIFEFKFDSGTATFR